MYRVLVMLTLLFTVNCVAADKVSGKHVFILSGQSNMSKLDPDLSFTPQVQAKLGKDNVIVIKYAKGGEPIRRWYKNWKAPDGKQPKEEIGDLYERLIAPVKKAVAHQTIKSVTFIWMQGERDAKESLADVYAESFKGILEQIRTDLKVKDINFVIGRINDFDMSNTKYPHWTKIRQIQEELATSDPHGAWINTDDLNDGITDASGKAIVNDLHMSPEGYKIMGTRFAEKALELLQKSADKPKDP